MTIRGAICGMVCGTIRGTMEGTLFPGRCPYCASSSHREYGGLTP